MLCVQISRITDTTGPSHTYQSNSRTCNWKRLAWVMSHIHQFFESCHTYISPVIHIHESCHLTHIHESCHVTHIHESYHTYSWVISPSKAQNRAWLQEMLLYCAEQAIALARQSCGKAREKLPLSASPTQRQNTWPAHGSECTLLNWELKMRFQIENTNSDQEIQVAECKFKVQFQNAHWYLRVANSTSNYLNCTWVTSHVWTSHVTHMNKSRHIYINETCHTCKCIMSHVWICPVTHVNE